VTCRSIIKVHGNGLSLDDVRSTPAFDHRSDCHCRPGYTGAGVHTVGYGSFMALVVSQPAKFASVLPTGIAEASGQWSGASSSTVVPAFVADGGQTGKGHLRFNRAQEQYLDAGVHDFKIASNGGFTAVAVIRFTATTASWERVFDIGNGQSSNNLMLAREDSMVSFKIYSDQGQGAKLCVVETRSDMVGVGQWMVMIARYDAETRSAELRVDNEVFSAACLGAVTDRKLHKSYIGKSQWLADGNSFLDADVAGLFLVDRYVEVNAAKAMAAAMAAGTNFAERAGRDSVCSACPAGKFKGEMGSGACTACGLHAHSTAGSSSCACVAGYTGPEGDGGACTACKPNTYKSAEGSAPCQACPPNTTTSTGGRQSICDCTRGAGSGPSHSVILAVSLGMPSDAFSGKVSTLPSSPVCVSSSSSTFPLPSLTLV
jgi:hypothetical protein